ncbi:hypothetical protein [Halomicrobium salinisoli]|uniref:hypothetical protein n=1 Tax=Halomicrobium salinisoli TaxID=2878391 RepID=UPI001CF03079|nr:hypothetical protein [Halomicrobium salinisoli]
MEDSAAESVGERADWSRLKRWILLDGNRNVITGILAGLVFLSIVTLAWFRPGALPSAMSSADPVETTFQALTTGVITGVTLVVTIGQLVLSEEFGPVGDQRERMDKSMSFYQSVDDMIEDPVTPADPAGLLESIVVAVGDRADDLAAAADDVDDEESRERLQAFAQQVEDDAAVAAADLSGTEFGTFETMLAALGFEYSMKVYEGRRLRETEPLPAPVAEALEDLLEALNTYAPAREHIKTLYFRSELAALSRAVVYSAVPALLISLAMITYGSDPSIVAGRPLGVDAIAWVVAAAMAVAVIPFALLLAYVVRVITVARRTLAIGPMVLRETDHPGRGMKPGSSGTTDDGDS